MSVTLPPEVFDLIVDHLHCEPTTLKACCLVSKSWVPRAQYHIFVDICFGSPTSVQLWMKAFPDPSNSPAHHTRTLSILGPWGFTAVQLTVVRPWVHSFRHIVSLAVTRFDGVSLDQLHGISPILKSLKLDIPSVSPLEIIDLICSFPLLENFWLRYGGFPTRNDPDGWNSPPTSPKLTGSLYLDGNICPVVRRMLDLPGGLHFAKISIHCYVKDAGITMDLVSKCSSTLGSLCVGYSLSRDVRSLPPLDLSEATKLEDVEFWWCTPEVRWITAALLTAKSDYLRQITIGPRAHLSRSVGEAIRREWQDLDQLLVRLWTSRSILPKIKYMREGADGRRGDLVPSLLPELTRMGAVEDLSTL